MENTNTRNIILGILGVAVIGAGALYFSSNNTNEVRKGDNLQLLEQVDVTPEFGDITSFVRSDLMEDEKEDLKVILEQRKDRQIQIKDILDMAYEKGDMEKAWIEVAEIREKCKMRILPFIAESKVERFENFCYATGGELEANYVQK